MWKQTAHGLLGFLVKQPGAQVPIDSVHQKVKELGRSSIYGPVGMSLSRPLAEAFVIRCDSCKKTFQHETNLQLHLEKSAPCRLQRAIIGLKRRRAEGRPDPPPPQVEQRPLSEFTVDDDPIDFVAIDDNDPVNQQPTSTDNAREAPAKEKVWDSTEQLVAWIKRVGLSQSQTDDFINLFRDKRMSLEEAFETIQSHRDIDRYLMGVIIGEVRN